MEEHDAHLRRRGHQEKVTQPAYTRDEGSEDDSEEDRQSLLSKNNSSFDCCATHRRGLAPQPSFYDYLWSVFAQLWQSFSGPLPLDAHIQQSLVKLKTKLTVPFDKDNTAHMDDLVLLWKIAFPEEPVPNPLPDDRWKALGFQSDDPLRDFRGTGIFGLQNFLFMAEKYPTTWSRIVDLNEEKGERYPVAIASFNVTMMLFELLGWGWRTPGQTTCKDHNAFRTFATLLFPDPGASIEEAIVVFNEIYSLSMLKLDEKWDEIAAGYMDFPVVLTKTQEEVEIILSGFRQIEDVYDWNKQNL
eukprot:TRINITY_DN686_c0_g1_i2.p1 TRINITY_DN686_c0_g1~~TRINITY_DN686_c0_g1_i2.p1  ORF type:complete len:301 (-),score=64.29 TRINITY_DN686_c0_g1_i2:47-949(-)